MDILFNTTLASERKSEYFTTVYTTQIWKKSTTITFQVSKKPRGDAFHYEKLTKSVEDLLPYTDFNFDAVADDGERAPYASAKIDTIWEEDRHKIIPPILTDSKKA